MATKPKGRLRVRRPDMTTVGAGLASLAVGAGLVAALPVFPEGRGRNFVWNIALAFTALGAVLFGVGIRRTVPAVVEHEAWNARYDALRHATVPNVLYIEQCFADSRGRGGTERATWEELARQVPLPKVDERPLCEWEMFLKEHPSPDIRSFYELARKSEPNTQIGEFRRLAVRTYDSFGRLLASEADGFADWMAQEDVRTGAEELVLLLAYLEIARASHTHFGGQGRGREGFWFLAETWHPNLVSLPR